MPLPESPPRKNSKGTVQRDRILHTLDPEGEEGHYARGGEVECDEEEEEAERKKRKAGGVAPGLAAPPRGDKGQRGRKAGGRTDKWIQGTGVDKPGHKGRLHRALHVPEGQPIPEKKLEG